jgi:2-oxoglutarate ferredoxin oxidoreductase subunit gamma
LKAMEREIIIAGIGGQGIQVIGKTLAHAAVFEEARAMYYSLFDGGQRGGVSDCIVSIGRDSIQAPPLIKQPCWVLVAMDPNGLVRYEKVVRPGRLSTTDQLPKCSVSDTPIAARIRLSGRPPPNALT